MVGINWDTGQELPDGHYLGSSNGQNLVSVWYLDAEITRVGDAGFIASLFAATRTVLR